MPPKPMLRPRSSKFARDVSLNDVGVHMRLPPNIPHGCHRRAPTHMRDGETITASQGMRGRSCELAIGATCEWVRTNAGAHNAMQP